MKADVSPNKPPSSALKTSGHSFRLQSLGDVREAGHGEEEQATAGLMANGKARKSGSRVQLAWIQNGHAPSFDPAAESTPASIRNTEGPRLKKRSHSAQTPNGPDSPAAVTRSHTTLPPCKPNDASRKGGSEQRKAALRKEVEAAGEDRAGASEASPTELSPSPRQKNSRSDTSAFVFADKPQLAPTGGKGPAGNSSGAGRSARRRLASRNDDLFPLNDSYGEPASPYCGSDRLQQSFNGTLSSDGSSDDHPRPRHQSPARGTGLKDQGGVSGADRGTPAGGGANPAGPGHHSGPRPWDVFEEHVRTIQDSSDPLSRRHGSSFQASSTFQETMVDLFGCPSYSHPPTQAARSVAYRKVGVTGAANRFLQLRGQSSVLGPATGVPEAPRGRKPQSLDRKTVENAKRGWRIVKQYVHDNYCSKRTSTAALSWCMIRQTLKGMTDREQTRLDLYRRYGIVPTPDDRGNLVMVNTMLSERARKAIASGSRHPLLVHPLSCPAPVAPASAPSAKDPHRSTSSASSPPSRFATARGFGGGGGDARRSVSRPAVGAGPAHHREVRPQTTVGAWSGAAGGPLGQLPSQTTRSAAGMTRRKGAE